LELRVASSNQPGGASSDDKKSSVAGTRSMIARRFPKWGAGSRLMPREESDKTSQKPIFIGPSPIQRPSACAPSSSLPLDRKHRATPCPLPIGQARGGRGAPIPLGGVSSGGVWWLRLLLHLRPRAQWRRCRVGGRARKMPASCRLATEGRHAYARLRPHACLLAGEHEECRERHGVRMDVEMALLSLMLLLVGYPNNNRSAFTFNYPLD